MRANRRQGNDAGSSVFEFSLTLALLSLVIAVALTWVASSQTNFKRTSERSQANGEATLGVNRLDRLIRSGNILYDPASESNPANDVHPGLSMRIYTQANSIQKCVQWRITNGQLQERSWSPAWETDGEVSDWWIVASSIANTVEDPAFALDSGTGYGGRLLNIDLWVDFSGGQENGVRQKTSIAGRNTEYGYDTSVCSNLPPY